MRVGVKTQMMTIIIDIEMMRVTSMHVQEDKPTGLGDYWVVGSTGEDCVKDDSQVSVLGN